MKKEIKFSAKLDSAEFDRSVEQMQRKLKDIYAPADAIRQQSQMANRMDSMGMGGNMSKPTQEAFQRSTQQARREVDQFLASEVKRQEQLSKTIEARISKLKQLKEEQAGLTKGSEEELKIKEKISRLETNNGRLREIERGRAQAINQTMDVRDQLNPRGFERLREGYQQGGIRGAAATGVDMLKSVGPAGLVSLIGGALVAAGAAAKIGGDLYSGFKNAPVNTASNYGSAMSGVLGKEVGAAYSGRSAIEMAFLPEKNRALQMANEAMKGQRVKNITDTLASPLDGAIGATLKGAAIGGGAGAFFGGIGAVPGAIGGGIAGFGMNALSNISGDPKKRALTMGMFSDTHNAEYESMMAKEFAGKYQEALQGLKEENPYKTAASEQYGGNYMRYLDSQRSMGLTNTQFHGGGYRDMKVEGFRENAINNGFTDDMAMGASSNILGAGGSTRMARDSVFALQAGRQFDQTNASNVLGTLSNSLGSSEASKQAYVKMLAEGTRSGLDSSEYREESRKMMEVTAGAINKSGVSSTADIERIVSQMGGFLSDKTNKGVQSAKEAFDYYNQASSETGGARGVMRAAGMMRNGVLGKMDALDRNSLAGYSGDQLDSNSDQMKYLAAKYNTTPQEIVQARLEVDKQGFNFRPGTDKAMNRATELRKKLSEGGLSEDERSKIQKELSSTMGEFETGLAVDNQGLAPRQITALAKGLTSTNLDERQRSLKEASISDQMLKKDGTGRIEDTSVAGAAESSRVVLDNFVKFKDQLVPTAEAVRQFNKQIAETVMIIDRMPAGDRAKYLQQLGFGAPETQSQSGKSSK